MSHLSQVRGLKPFKEPGEMIVLESHLSQVRGLKLLLCIYLQTFNKMALLAMAIKEVEENEKEDSPSDNE